MSQHVGPFRITFAFGPENRAKEYRLRYRVFVEECGFESALEHPDGLERDRFDDASCALFLEDRATGRPAGCQRLVLPDLLPPGTLTNIEREYVPLAGCRGIDFENSQPHGWAEASRTTVDPAYRWGSAGASMPAFQAIHYGSIALAIAFGRSALFSLSPRHTSRLIRRLGFTMVQVGAPVDFHGVRTPFRMDVSEMLAAVPPAARDTVDQLVIGALHVADLARRFAATAPREAVSQ